MTKTHQVKWNGLKEDPDTIVQHGIEFEKGQWTPVPDESDPKGDPRHPHRHRIEKLKANPQFEVKGHEADKTDEAPAAPPAHTAPVRAPATSYSVQSTGKGKKKVYIVVGKDGAAANSDEYADEASAQAVADAMNKVP
jgi:hypothetical protein